MPSSDEFDALAQKNRRRLRLLAVALGFCALGLTIVYVKFLQSLGWLLLGLLVGLEWLVMVFVYLIIHSKMRPRRR
jgi:hypothetical protein